MKKLTSLIPTKYKKMAKPLTNPKSAWQTSLLVGFVGLIYAIRAHPYLFKPQLFAEDGILWLGDGVNKGVSSIFQSDNGFMHFPERLFGLVVAHISLLYAPIIFDVTAWVLFILMAYYLLSSRTNILKTNYERVFVVLSLALIANIEVFFFEFSNSVFLMGIIAALIMVAKTPKNIIVKIFEKAFFLLSCLTLCFAWILFPIALYDRLKHKSKEWYFLGVSFIASIVQLIYYITSHVNRSPVTLSSLFTSPYTLLELNNQVLIPAIRFARIDTSVLDYATHRYNLVIVCLTVLTMAIAGWLAIKKDGKQSRYLLFFLVGMTFASFKSPTLHIQTSKEALETMSVVSGAGRYFVYGIIGAGLILAKSSYQVIVPYARYIVVSIFFAFGLITSLHYQTFFVNENFVNYTQQYSQGIKKFESGKYRQVVIPVNPTPWVMALQKN